MTNKYKASQIVERALNLADIANTDFLTYTENLRYLGDAWNQCYQALINKGDSQFITEAELSSNGNYGSYTEYILPDDLYQIKSLKNKITGDLVPRYAESQSINSGTYDIVNNRLRLYGVCMGSLLLTYYRTPTYISFPDEDIDVNINGEIVSTAGNSVLLNDGTIKNLVTGDSLGAVEIEDGKQYILGNGHIAVISENNITYINYDGVVIRSITTTGTISTFLDSDYNVIYQTMVDSKLSAPKLLDRQLFSTVDYETEGYPAFVSEYDGIWLYWDQADETLNAYDEDGDQIIFETSLPFTPSTIIPAERFDGSRAWTISDTNGNVYFIVLEEIDSHWEMNYDCISKPTILLGLLKYGPITSNGTTAKVESCMPDTLMNFPNELYFSILACDLALRYAMKMNANTEGLNNLYTNMWNQYLNTLSQASDYTRIKNIYGRR